MYIYHCFRDYDAKKKNTRIIGTTSQIHTEPKSALNLDFNTYLDFMKKYLFSFH